jgi:hypothetical protein
MRSSYFSSRGDHRDALPFHILQKGQKDKRKKMALRYISLDYYETLIVGSESRITEHRSVGLYLDIGSNPIFDVAEDRYPFSTTRGLNGFKDEDLNGSGAIHKMHYEDPKVISNRTGSFTILFILGNILTGHGTQIQAPFVDQLFIAMSEFFGVDINILNCDEYIPLLVGNVLVSPFNHWIYPGMGVFAGPDGTEMSLRKDDGTLRRFKRNNRNRIITTNTINPLALELAS